MNFIIYTASSKSDSGPNLQELRNFRNSKLQRDSGPDINAIRLEWNGSIIEDNLFADLLQYLPCKIKNSDNISSYIEDGSYAYKLLLRLRDVFRRYPGTGPIVQGLLQQVDNAIKNFQEHYSNDAAQGKILYEQEEKEADEKIERIKQTLENKNCCIDSLMLCTSSVNSKGELLENPAPVVAPHKTDEEAKEEKKENLPPVVATPERAKILLEAFRSNSSVRRLSITNINCSELQAVLCELFRKRCDFEAVRLANINLKPQEMQDLLDLIFKWHQIPVLQITVGSAELDKEILQKINLVATIRSNEANLDFSKLLPNTGSDNISKMLELMCRYNIEKWNLGGLSFTFDHALFMPRIIAESRALKTIDFSNVHFADEEKNGEDKYGNVWVILLQAIRKNSSLTSIILANTFVAQNSALCARFVKAMKLKGGNCVLASQAQQQAAVQADVKEDSVPERFCCEINEHIMVDPVIAADGHHYERETILEWINQHGTSPFNQALDLRGKELTTDRRIRDEISNYVKEHPECWDKIFNSPSLLTAYNDAKGKNDQTTMMLLTDRDPRLSKTKQEIADKIKAAEQSQDEESKLQFQPKIEIDDLVICPLSGKIMFDPVFAADGNTYEREELEKSLASSDTKKKLSQEIQDDSSVTPHKKIREKINKLLQKNPGLRYSDQFYFSEKLQQQLLQALHDKNQQSVIKIADILNRDERLLTRYLLPERNLLNLSCGSTPEILKLVVEKMGDKFWELPEVKYQQTRKLFRMAACELGKEGAQIIVDLLDLFQFEIQEEFIRAINEGNIKLAQVCLELGAKVTEDFPLHCALQRGQVNAVQFLFEAKATADIPDNNGNYPIHCAVMGNYACLQFLLENNEIHFNLDVKNAKQETPLQWAVDRIGCGQNDDFWKSAQLLIKYGADLNIPNKFGDNILLQAINAGNKELFDLVMVREKNPANLEMGGEQKITALHLALKLKKFDFVEKLVEKKANLEARNTDGDTALLCVVKLYAENANNQELLSKLFNLAKFMIERGADCYALDRGGCGHGIPYIAEQKKNLSLLLLMPFLTSVADEIQKNEKALKEQAEKLQKLHAENNRLKQELLLVNKEESVKEHKDQLVVSQTFFQKFPVSADADKISSTALQPVPQIVGQGNSG